MIYIGELFEEIIDVIDKQMEYDKKQFFKEIYKYYTVEIIYNKHLLKNPYKYSQI